MAKNQEKQAKEGLGRLQVIGVFILGLMFALYCVFGLMKPPSITTMLDEIGSKHGEKHEAPSSTSDKVE